MARAGTLKFGFVLHAHLLMPCVGPFGLGHHVLELVAKTLVDVEPCHAGKNIAFVFFSECL